MSYARGETRECLCMISGFCHGVNELVAVLGCYAPQTGSCQRFVTRILDCLTLEDGTDSFSQNIGN
jgi:hypothetical protein